MFNNSTASTPSLGKVAGWVAGAIVGFLGFRLVCSSERLPRDLLTRPWVTTKMGANGFQLDTPWQLESQKMPFSVALAAKLREPAVCFGHTEDAGGVMAMRFPVVRNAEADLDGAATGMVDGMGKTPGAQRVEKQLRETTLLGERAIELTCRIVREKGKALRVLGIVAMTGGDLVQVSVMSYEGDPLLDDLWRRVRASIREQ